MDQVQAVLFLCFSYKLHGFLCADMLYIYPAAGFKRQGKIPFYHGYLSFPVSTFKPHFF